MPGLDRTGPEGKGSQTGRKMGKCNPSKSDSNDPLDQETLSERSRFGRGRNQSGEQGRGFGKGDGKGRRMRRRGD